LYREGVEYRSADVQQDTHGGIYNYIAPCCRDTDNKSALVYMQREREREREVRTFLKAMLMGYSRERGGR